MDQNIISPQVIYAVKSPLSVFVITILTCNTVFGICATWFKKEVLFVYCLHAFLAIVFFFGLLVIWTPRFLYHPSEIIAKDLPYNPWVPTVIAFAVLLIYMAFNIIYDKWIKH